MGHDSDRSPGLAGIADRAGNILQAARNAVLAASRLADLEGTGAKGSRAEEKRSARSALSAARGRLDALLREARRLGRSTANCKKEERR